MREGYYFPHFSTARNDRKVRRIRKELGIEGYGIFFMLLEILREQTDLRYPLEDIDLLADEFGTSEQKIRTVICNYGLFEIDESEKFFSPRLLLYLEPYFQKSERARKAAKIRWEKDNFLPEHNASNANAMQMHSKCNANAMQMHSVSNADAMQRKEKKRKEKKEEESIGKSLTAFIPPSLQDVKNYIKEKKLENVNAEEFYYFYEAKNWYIGKNKMKKWEAAVAQWNARNKKQESRPAKTYAEIEEERQKEAKERFLRGE